MIEGREGGREKQVYTKKWYHVTGIPLEGSSKSHAVDVFTVAFVQAESLILDGKTAMMTCKLPERQFKEKDKPQTQKMRVRRGL